MQAQVIGMGGFYTEAAVYPGNRAMSDEKLAKAVFDAFDRHITTPPELEAKLLDFAANHRFAVDEIVTPIDDSGCVRIVVEVHPDRGWIRVEDRDAERVEDVPAPVASPPPPVVVEEVAQEESHEPVEVPHDGSLPCPICRGVPCCLSGVPNGPFIAGAHEPVRAVAMTAPCPPPQAPESVTTRGKWKRSGWLDPLLWKRFRG